MGSSAGRCSQHVLDTRQPSQGEAALGAELSPCAALASSPPDKCSPCIPCLARACLRTVQGLNTALDMLGCPHWLQARVVLDPYAKVIMNGRRQFGEMGPVRALRPSRAGQAVRAGAVLGCLRCKARCGKQEPLLAGALSSPWLSLLCLLLS